MKKTSFYLTVVIAGIWMPSTLGHAAKPEDTDKYLKSLGQLSWESMVGTQTVKTSKVDTAAVLATKGLKFAKVEYTPVKSIQMAGLLESDPKFRSSEDAAKKLKNLPALGFCARLHHQENSRTECKNRLLRAILRWTTTNVPAGNPIDDSFLLPLIQAIDLAKVAMPAKNWVAAEIWLRKIFERSDIYWSTRTERTWLKQSNYMSWALGVRALAAVVLDDKDKKKNIAAQFAKHVQKNINDDGSTLDFRSRDAFHYHLYSLRPQMTAALLAPEIVTENIRYRICLAYEFIKPYYQGKKSMSNSRSLDLHSTKSGVKPAKKSMMLNTGIRKM